MLNTKERVKYDINTTKQCPLCGEEIQVSTAGPRGLAQHRGKKKCLATTKKKEQAAAKAREPILFLYLHQKDTTLPTPTDLVREPKRNDAKEASRIVESIVVSQVTIPEVTPGMMYAALHADHNIQGNDKDIPFKARAGVGVHEPWARSTVLNTNAQSKIWTIDGTWHEAEDMQSQVQRCKQQPQDKIWENLNPGLDRILSFGRPEEEIATLICCSREGLQGLYEYLEVLVKQGGIVGGLLEGKVEALITAMAMLPHLSPAMQVCASTPLPMSGTWISASTSYMYQPIGGPIEILWKKSAMLDGLCFKQLSTLQTLAAQQHLGGLQEFAWEFWMLVKERLQWDPSTNRILGLCQEHMEHVGLDFCSMSDVQACSWHFMWRDCHASEVHNYLINNVYITNSGTCWKATVFSIGIILGNRHVSGSRTFIIAGTCRQEGCDRHTELISTVIDMCNAEFSTIGCPLFSIPSDGESHRGATLTKLTHCQLLEPDSELFALLGELCLMNLLVGNNDIMANKDPKHVMKCCQNFSIHKSSVMVNGFMVTPVLLRFHLQANKVPPHCIDYLLNPTDHQDVPEIWSLPPPSLTDKPGFVVARGALMMLSKAMPSLTFKVIVLLVKNAYFCVVKVKICNPDGNFYLILNGTDRIEDGNGNVCSKCDHITPDSWQGCIDLHNVSLVTAWNLGCQMISSEFVAINIESILQELEHKGYEMEFPFSQVPESANEYNDEYNGDHSPIAPDMQSLSAQDVTTILLLLNPGEGNDPVLDLEDHASIKTSHDGQGKFSPFIDIGNGKEVPKAHALRKLERATFSKVPGSIDCLNRCARLSHYTKTATLSDLACGLIDSTSEVLLSIGDPAAMVVQCDGQFFLAFIQINEILVDTSPVHEISPRFLMEPTVTIQFQIYQIIETSQVDPNVDSADWKWNRKLEHTILKTTGSFIQVINPAIAIPEINSPMSYKQLQCASLAPSQITIAVNSCVSRGLGAHYCLAHAACLCEAEVNERPITGSAGAQSDHCSAMHVPLAPMLILFVKRKGGRESTADQQVHFSLPKPHREVVLLSSSNRVHQFTLYQHPDHLPSCPSTSAAVWKYSMKIHLAQVHPSTKGGDFHQVYMISKSEKATLKLLWEKLLWHLSSSDNAAANDTAHEPEMSEDNPASSGCDSDLDASTRTDQNGHSEDSNQEDVKTLDNDLEDEFAITPENQAIITSEERRAPDTPENHRMPWMPEEFEDGKSLSEPRITHALTIRMIQPIAIQCSLTQSRQDKKRKGPLRHSEMTQLRLPSWSQ
ncbi:hypothetical protein EI94DRAFT_1703093 [Lactarius quietus]|nr:hypothetical protein EI94DRAFT_1703093 [Lactarius quietus]